MQTLLSNLERDQFFLHQGTLYQVKDPFTCIFGLVTTDNKHWVSPNIPVELPFTYNQAIELINEYNSR